MTIDTIQNIALVILALALMVSLRKRARALHPVQQEASERG